MKNNENESEFFIIPLQLAIYLSLIVGNILFALMYSEYWFVGALGAVFFLGCYRRASAKEKPKSPAVVAPGAEPKKLKTDSTH